VKRLTLAAGIAAAAIMTGCATNNSMENVTALDGRVAVGYLSDALVCADLNENWACEADEPVTHSDSNGRFTLYVPNDEVDNPIIAVASKGVTMDRHTGDPVAHDFTMAAHVDLSQGEQFISPLTTLVVHEMGEGFSYEQAKDEVRDLLLTGLDPTANYLEEAHAPHGVRPDYVRLHRISEVLAHVGGKFESFAVADGATQEQAAGIANVKVNEMMPTILEFSNVSLTDPDFDVTYELSAQRGL